jgi:hypothetical protein
MKLSEQAIDAMPTGSKLRKRLSYELNVDRTTIDRWVEKNEEDGDLTRITALNIISEETGLAMDEILISESTKKVTQ